MRKCAYEGFASFLDDAEKMHDFITLSMDEFLETYSYLKPEDYYATYDEVMRLSIEKSKGGGGECVTVFFVA